MLEDSLIALLFCECYSSKCKGEKMALTELGTAAALLYRLDVPFTLIFNHGRERNTAILTINITVHGNNKMIYTFEFE